MMALGSMLTQDGLLRAADMAAVDPWMPKQPHFPAKAKNCIFIFMEGAPSADGPLRPEAEAQRAERSAAAGQHRTKNVRFAFIKKETAKLMGSRAPLPSMGRAAWSSAICCRTWRRRRTSG